MSYVLHQVIYGKPVVEGELQQKPVILASSGNFTPEEIAQWRSLVALAPLGEIAADEGLKTQTFGVFEGPGADFLFARAHYRYAGDEKTPIYHYVRLPHDLWLGLAGNLSPLCAISETPIVPPNTVQAAIPPLEFSAPAPISQDERATMIEAALEIAMNFGRLLSILDAALDDSRLLLQGFPPSIEKRLTLVQGLMMLLPPQVRGLLTFSLNADEIPRCAARLVFSDTTESHERRVINWAEANTTEAVAGYQSIYIARLAALWRGEVAAFLNTIQPLEEMVAHFLDGRSIQEALQASSERHILDERVMQHLDIVDTEGLKNALTGSYPPEGELYTLYIKQLLHHAIHARDSEAARIVTQAIETEPTLIDYFDRIFNDTLQDQPDAAYALVRARLAEGVNDYWLPRLKTAAMRALDIAVHAADTQILSSWLTLISREPQNYDLSEILHQGIVAAQPRAREDGNLGSKLITLAAKRDPQTLDQLLSDAALTELLPSPFNEALLHYDPNAILQLLEQGREIFFVALGRTAHANIASAFTSEVLQNFWHLYLENNASSLTSIYHPAQILETLITTGATWLNDDAVLTLMTLLLADQYDELFLQFAGHLGEYERLYPPLATALQHSGRGVNSILDIVGQLLNHECLTEQQASNTYVTLLNGWDWHQNALPLAQQLARMLQQNANLSVAPQILWQLLKVAGEIKDEHTARAATRRLWQQMEHIDDDATNEFVETLIQLQKTIQWNANLRGMLLKWWRDYVRNQPLVRLQKLDRTLEGKRNVDDIRTIVQTGVALRRLLGQRSLSELAEGVQTAYAILELLSDAFDPSPRGEVELDIETLRAGLAAREEELSPDERRILAKDFKELAQLIISLAENRRKRSLIRGEENIDRQLMSGEEAPQSAVEAMKWMSGYLNGMHKQDSDNE